MPFKIVSLSAVPVTFPDPDNKGSIRLKKFMDFVIVSKVPPEIQNSDSVGVEPVEEEQLKPEAEPRRHRFPFPDDLTRTEKKLNLT